jgi:hypothetical protein
VVMRMLFIFFKSTIESKNIELFNLTAVCERRVLTYSHHFDVFHMERQP